MNSRIFSIIFAGLLSLISCEDSDNDRDNDCLKTTWYEDKDKDGLGAKDKATESCTQPEGYVLNHTDCDDSDASIGVCKDDSLANEFDKHYFIHELTKTSIPYSFFKPKNANNPNVKYPLVIALHGAEYFSTNESGFLKPKTAGYFALAWIEKENQEQYPAYVLAPHLTEDISTNNTDYFGWDTATATDFVEQLMDDIVANENIDKNRIYLTGHSMGGLGAWFIGVKLKERLAAIVPLSSVVDKDDEMFLDEIAKGSFKDLPIWNFIHQRDGGSKDSREYFKIFSDMGYNPVYTHNLEDISYDLTTEEIMAEINAGKKHFHTEYNYSPCTPNPANCHFVFYTALREPFLFEWLFKQTKQ